MGSVAMATSGKDAKITGFLMDNACAGRTSADAAAERAKGHTTKCALMGPCAASGYSVYSDGKFYKLDDGGNTKAGEILKSTKSEKGISVTVEGTVEGDMIKVKKIEETK
jgi:hypothetical protein